MTPPSATDRRAAVIGPGAVGTTVAALAQQAGVGVTLFGRTPLERVELRRDGSEPIVMDGPVVTDPATLPGPVPWVFLTVKAHQTEGAAPWLRALAGPETVIVVIQNGVEHRERIAPLGLPGTVLPAIARFPANVVTPGVVELHARATLIVPDSAAGTAFQDLLAGVDAEIKTSAQFQSELWRKLCGNVIGALMALTGGRAGIFRRADIRALAGAAGDECVAVGRAEGADLPDGLGASIAEQYGRQPADMISSIATDREAGRPLEWDAMNGAVCRFGRRHGIGTPVNDVLAALLAAASDAGRLSSP